MIRHQGSRVLVSVVGVAALLGTWSLHAEDDPARTSAESEQSSSQPRDEMKERSGDPAGAQAQERRGPREERAASSEDRRSKSASPKMKEEERAQQAGTERVIAVTIPVFEVRPGAVAAEPERFYGELVSLQAEVEDLYSAHAFTLDEDRVGAGPDVMVIVPRPEGEIAQDEDVRVVGQVRPLVVADLERDYDWFDGSWFDETDVDLNSRPVVIAISVKRADGSELNASAN